MILWDIIIKYSNKPPFSALSMTKVPNGNPLPYDSNGIWERTLTAVSGDEADAQINEFNKQITKRKC